jgi:cobalt/nickel transport system permease protein
VVVGLAAVAGLSPGRLARRLAIETPFVLFALLLPVVGQGRRVDVLGVSLAVEGLWGMWNILAKATIGVAATMVVVSTTTITDVLSGLERLHMPRPVVLTASFMVRYVDVIAGEMQRMKIARLSRAHDPRWIWQARAVASTAGALFVRSYERGERVYLAMLSRGYSDTIPRLDGETATARGWATALSLPAGAGLVALSAWTVLR